MEPMLQKQVRMATQIPRWLPISGFNTVLSRIYLAQENRVRDDHSMAGQRPSTRRHFAAVLAASGTAVPAVVAQQMPAQQAPSAAASRRGPAPEVTPFEGPIQFTRKAVPLRAEPFPMAQVRLLAGIYKDVQEWNRGYLQRLNADRLVRDFRLNAGLASTAEPLGGWEMYQDPAHREQDCEVRGHFTGHYLSASALMYASTGDKDIKAKGDYIVAELAKCQEKLGGRLLERFPDRVFRSPRRAQERLGAVLHHPQDHGRHVRHVPARRQQAGAADARRHGGLGRRTGPLRRAKSTCRRSSTRNTAAWPRRSTIWPPPPTTTSGPRPATDSPRSASSIRWPLRRDELRGLHVNTHVPQVIAAARRYEISGDTRFHDVADFFWLDVDRGAHATSPAAPATARAGLCSRASSRPN